jgi:carbon-monoxide dehydrogenase large subunit
LVCEHGAVMSVPPSVFGIPALRSEDPRFLRGEGRYLANIAVPGALAAVFCRSIFPHAVLNGVDGVDAARAAPGVAGVFTADDLDLEQQTPSGNVEAPGDELDGFHRDPIARDRMRYVGEPYAVVVARTPGEAMDAAQLITPDIEPVPAVLDPEAALAAGAPELWPGYGTNVAHGFSHAWDDDVLAGAQVVVAGRFVNQRVAPAPMEPNAIAVVPDGDGWTVWVSSQVPFDVRSDLAEVWGLPRDRVRVIAPDVGGGFGAKLLIYPEYLAVAKAAALVGRPVRWIETRSENLVSMNHGRAQVQRVQLGARRDGTLVGLRAEIVADMGAYPVGAFLPVTTGEMSAGVYTWEGGVAYRGWAVVTNTTPVMAYRGAGRPEATALVERAVDLVAAELGMDPVEVRRRNLVEPSAFPFTTATGMVYDTGDYTAPLDAVLETVDVPALRREQQRRRDRGDRSVLGIGVATYVEITGFPSKDFAAVQIAGDGSVTVRTGISPHGQGHETSLAQLAAGMLAVPMATVRVVHSDTAEVQRGEGTWGSRSLQVAGTRVAAEAAAVIDRGRALAAASLEVDPADLEGPVEGGFRVAGAPDRAVTWSALAQAAARSGEPLAASGVARDPGETFPFGAHIAVVEVDLETGMADLLRLAAVDDCGRILNPMLVRGQQHGGMAQGVAQALFEEVRFDADGNPITATLAAYPVPSAADLPGFETASTQTPTDVNPLGVKGIGEAGSIGSTPAVQNAVVDALAHLGVRHVDLPCTPERVWRAIRDAGGGPDRPPA